MSTAAVLEIRPIELAEIAELGGELFAAHYEESAKHKDVMRLDPDLLRYRALEAAGSLLILGAFAGTELVGYSVNFITTLMHYQELLVCQNDVLFLREDCRRARNGRRLIEATEAAAAARGCELVLMHAKEGSALDVMLSRSAAYGVQDIIYSRRV